MSLAYAWSCLACPESGAGPKSDLAARKHEDATSHATTTHLERAEWSDPVRVGEVLPDVVREMVRRGRRGGVSPVQQGDSCGSASHSESGLDGTIGAQVKTAPAVRQHCDSGASPTNKESTG